MSTGDPRRTRARQLAQDYVAKGDALGWFEVLYSEAQADPRCVPWADLEPNPHLVAWLSQRTTPAEGRAALVVGCGLGDDAEFLRERGYRVVAFDISVTAVGWCRSRFPQSAVDYVAADLLQPKPAWNGAFDFVFEAYTLQVLPRPLRQSAMQRAAEFLKPGGTLLVVCRGREPDGPEGQMPWPLLREELSEFERCGLALEGFEEFWDQREDPPVWRFRASYTRPAR